MLVKDVMTKNPVFVRKNDTLKKLLRLLSEKRISGCPVIDRDRNVTGIVTETDVVRLIDVHAKVYTSVDSMFSLVLAMIKSEKYDNIKGHLKKVFEIRIKDFMSKKAITIDEDEDLYNAAKLMNRNNINKLPVTRDSQLIGMISKWDIIRTLEKMED